MSQESMLKQQIRARGITDRRVLDAMAAVKRHEFVPEHAQAEAYADSPLPIGHGQTISQPYIVALMSEELRIKPGDRVLEVGTGSGYQAAVLAEMGARVFSVELIGDLAEQARRNLDRAGYPGVQIIQGDGFQGWPEQAPYQGILAACSPSQVPQALRDQLAVEGRIVIPVGSASMQELAVLTKTASTAAVEGADRTAGAFAERRIAPVRFVPMQNGAGRRY